MYCIFNYKSEKTQIFLYKVVGSIAYVHASLRRFLCWVAQLTLRSSMSLALVAHSVGTCFKDLFMYHWLSGWLTNLEIDLLVKRDSRVRLLLLLALKH